MSEIQGPSYDGVSSTDFEGCYHVPDLDERTSKLAEDQLSQCSSQSSSSARSSFEAVRDFFVSSHHPSKMKKYIHILNQYIDHLGGEKVLRNAYEELKGFEQTNSMVENATKAYAILLGEGKWAEKNERERYQAFVSALRDAIETPQYQRVRGIRFAGPSKRGLYVPLSQRHNKEAFIERAIKCVTHLQNLVDARWFQSEMYTHLKQATNRFTSDTESSDDEISLDHLTEEDYPRTFKAMNERIKTASPELKKRPASLGMQMLKGATGMKDFSGTENIPYIRCRYDYQDESGETETIHYMRHSRPTVGGRLIEFVGSLVTRLFSKIFGNPTAHDGEKIASDYEEAIRLAGDRKEAIFYVVHQRRSQGLFENEADSTHLIENLDDKHQNFHTLIQSVEGPLFERGEGYEFFQTMGDLKLALLQSFENSPKAPNRLPNAVNTKEYRQVMGELFDDVRSIFFSEVQDGQSLTQSQWEKMILYFYVFQKDDLKFRLSNGDHTVKYYTTPCKDFLDRGGNMAMVEDFVHYHMAGAGPSREDLEHTLYTTLGAPILVKKKQVIEGRVERGLEIVEDLSRLSADQRGKLQEYRFQGRKLARVDYPTHS
ncbi:MAG: hypothetical protein H7A38_02740 [Chlamydiales bacterium]|nr:hypothetical protein [Chlamydiales bacterium]